MREITEFPVPCDVCHYEIATVESEDGLVCRQCRDVRAAMRRLREFIAAEPRR